MHRTKKGKFLPGKKSVLCSLDEWSTLEESFGEVAEKRVAKTKPFVVKIHNEETEDMSPQMWEAELHAYTRLEKQKQTFPRFSFPKFYGYVRCKDDLENRYIFMEWIGNRSLQQMIQEAPIICKKILKEFWLGLLYTLAEAITFLESIGINHRDFHSSNIHIMDNQLKVFDFGLSVGKKTTRGKGWTVTDWGGNFMGEFTTSKFVLGFDLHCFLTGLMLHPELVPKEILGKAVFPFLKTLSAAEKKKYDALNFDDPPYFEIEFEGKSKIVPGNLISDWLPTSGPKYLESVTSIMDTL